MKKITTLLCGILLSLCAYTQQITVQNTTTLQVIEGVIVTANNISLKTNELGRVELRNVAATAEITFKHPSFDLVTHTMKSINDNNGIVLMTEKISNFDEIIVSASKFEEKRGDVAQPIQVIRKTDLEDMNQSSTADVIANTGNVMVQKSQLGGGSPIIRGFETNKVLMVVDGVRMNNAIYRGGHLQNIITLDNAMMDKVEIVYGPGSVVYGSDALGGVMHFYTKNPTLSTSDKTLVKAGAYTRYMSAVNGYAAHADVSVGGKKIRFIDFFYVF